MQLNIYMVRSTGPGSRSYPNHYSDNVLAADLLDAARTVQDIRPGASILTVAHKGKFDPRMLSIDAFNAIVQDNS